QVRASVAQGGDLEASAIYQGSLLGLKAKAGAGVEFNNDLAVATNNPGVRYAASASLAHSSGLAAMLSYTANDLDAKAVGAHDPSAWYGKIGYAWGQDSMYEIAADYGTAEHFSSVTAADDELNAWGLAAQYNVMDGVSMAMLYRNFDL